MGINQADNGLCGCLSLPISHITHQGLAHMAIPHQTTCSALRTRWGENLTPSVLVWSILARAPVTWDTWDCCGPMRSWGYGEGHSSLEGGVGGCQSRSLFEL